jgi:hypothetical protein
VDVMRLAEATGGDDRRQVARRRRAARRSRGPALSGAARVASRRPEVWRLVARERWLEGDRPGSREAAAHGLEVARSLGARPEWGRLCADLAAFLDEEGAGARFDGRPAEAWRRDAEAHFEACGLAADRERLA